MLYAQTLETFETPETPAEMPADTHAETPVGGPADGRWIKKAAAAAKARRSTRWIELRAAEGVFRTLKLGDEKQAPVYYWEPDVEALAARTNPTELDLARRHLEDLQTRLDALKARRVALCAEVEAYTARAAERAAAEERNMLAAAIGDDPEPLPDQDDDTRGLS